VSVWIPTCIWIQGAVATGLRQHFTCARILLSYSYMHWVAWVLRPCIITAPTNEDIMSPLWPLSKRLLDVLATLSIRRKPPEGVSLSILKHVALKCWSNTYVCGLSQRMYCETDPLIFKAILWNVNNYLWCTWKSWQALFWVSVA
jgi:hypothetical protein